MNDCNLGVGFSYAEGAKVVEELAELSKNNFRGCKYQKIAAIAGLVLGLAVLAATVSSLAIHFNNSKGAGPICAWAGVMSGMFSFGSVALPGAYKSEKYEQKTQKAIDDLGNRFNISEDAADDDSMGVCYKDAESLFAQVHTLFKDIIYRHGTPNPTPSDLGEKEHERLVKFHRSIHDLLNTCTVRTCIPEDLEDIVSVG